MSNDIREAQIRDGRAMAKEDGCSYSRPRISAKPRAPKKPEGHEAFLKMLETSKAEIKVTTLYGDVYTGIVRHSDKYTISIKNGDEGTVVFFKHGIEQFEPIEPAPNKENPEVQHVSV